jgi:hypothetical protein
MFWFPCQGNIMSVRLKMAETFVLQKVRFDYGDILKLLCIGSKVQIRESIYESFACIGLASGAT